MKSIGHQNKLAIFSLFIFCCFQFGFCLSDQTSPLKYNHIDSIDQDQDLSDEKLILSPFLNPGEILGYFHPGDLQDADSINLVISKDGKTLFSMFNFDLRIYNISNPTNPQVGFLEAIAGWSISMLLSPDDKVLYLHGSGRLQAINVTNITSPVQLGYKDVDTSSSFSSQVISSDGKTLYTLDEDCLNIWDVSKPGKPRYVSSKTGKYAGGIAISKSNTKLAVGLEKKFQIYNIEDPEDLKSICTKKINGDVYSMAFSDDEKRLFIGVDKSKTVIEPNLEIYNITNLKSPSLLVSTKLADEVSSGRLWFHSNEEYAFYTTAYEFKMVRIADFQQITLFSSTTQAIPVPFTATPDNTINVIYSSDNIIMMKLNIDIVPSSFVHFKPNALKVIDEVDYDRRPAMAVSKEGKNIFLVKNGHNETASVIPYEQTNPTSFQQLNPVPNLEPTGGMPFDMSANWNLVAGRNVVAATYMRDKGEPMLYMITPTNENGSYQLVNFNYDGGFDSRIPAFALTGDDQNIIFINETTEKKDKHQMTLNILTLNKNELRNTLVDFKMPYSYCYPFSAMKLAQDDKILFYANCDLLIYNLSNLSSPTLESQYNLSVSRTYGFSLSQDQKILYLFGLGWNGIKNLQIFNISNLKAPKLLSRVEILLVSEGTDLTEISSDGKTLFLGFKDGILKVDVRVPSSPILFGYNYFLQKMDAEKFVPKNGVFYALSHSGVSTFDITSEHILYLKNPQLKIGGSYLRALNVLKLNKNFKFDFMMKKHKFLKVSLFNNSISFNGGSSLKTLPNWITFDQERSLLKIDPSSPSHNGTYKISVTLTTQTQPSVFIGLNSITGIPEAKELILNLVQSGYIDNQGYISGDLDLNQELLISSKYQGIEKEIRGILSGNYIQAIGEIFVSSSLSISETKPLRISSLSKNTIYVTIQFDHNNHLRFLNKAYSSLKPTIVNSKSLLLLEGPLENINEALQEIVVDLDGVCDGAISINDGINPPISRRIANLSNYLHINEKPENNLKNLQGQIDSNSFYTGLYSAMIIDSSTFTDKNNLTLEYSLELEDPKLGLPPAWITLKGLSLMATPPERYTKFSYKFALRISNEFQNITVPFTLKVRISFYYAVKLAMTFLGYTVSFIGFVYSVNKGYNILARKYYRHPRSFKLKVDEEINDSKIFSVSFINNEMGKIKNIFKALEKHVSQNYDKMSLLEYCVDSHSQILDKEKIIITLEALENENYKQADSFSRRIIQQLVTNKIVMHQLASKQGASTRDIFNKIKNKWMDLVIVSSSAPSQFVINSESLAEELSEISLGYGGESLDETHFESSDLLIEKNKLNMDLLANAIISYAFEFQNIDIDLILIDVISYKRIRGKTLYHLIKKFLLKNLKPFAFLNKREIGCGIEYKTENNTLHFFGRLTHELKGGTIVVHLKNNRGRILREFWIVGDNQAIQSQQSYMQNVSEIL